ncbi:putative uncharacterized protein [Rhodococcus sp. AW25M09]|jgi:hypothetical protein|uniref:DUF4192 domain-containing protein n=2 Tax=Mycobacteriales TaxID=85007 RepID=UPI0002ABDAFF|nr:DUF4192 domain-containing protein [Rhodococcus sp. AW25M09]CCQ18032.1 putative uncharacterized protein [Rhodococcus sp. AW25M09]
MTQHRMSLTTAADTLAAIPALLGFTPDNSVVIIALADDGNGSHLVAPTARVDAHQAEAAAGIITDALTRQDTPITAVILAAIADTTHAGAALLGLDAIRDALAAAGIRTIRALHTYSLTAGTTFTDLDRFTDGTIPDPATTELATARTADGAVIAASRADLEARYAPTTEIPESLALAAAATMGADFLPVTFDELAAVIHAREIPSADLTARVGLALATGHLEVRDAFLALSIHGDADAADAFTRIAAPLRGTARANALTIAAYFVYCTGDGAAAHAALQAAERTAERANVPLPSLTGILLRVLNAGMPPEEVRGIGAVITPDYIAAHIGAVQSYT